MLTPYLKSAESFCAREVGVPLRFELLSDRRHPLFRVRGARRTGVLKVHVDCRNLWAREVKAHRLFDGFVRLPGLWNAEWTGSVGFVLTEYVDGVPLSARIGDPDFPLEHAFRQAAEIAKAIHTVGADVGSSDTEMFEIDTLLQLGLGTNAFGEVLVSCLERVKKHLGGRWFNRIRPAAHKAAEALRGIQQTGCLIHGDFQPRNLLVRNDGLVAAVIDWELARISVPVCDLAALLRFTSTTRLERAVLAAYAAPSSPSYMAKIARCFDLARVGVGLSSADWSADDIPAWVDFLNGCADYVLDGRRIQHLRMAAAKLLNWREFSGGWRGPRSFRSRRRLHSAR